MRRFVLLLTLLAAALSFTSVAQAGRRVALVLGNAGYGVNDDLAALPNVRNDVPVMTTTLRNLGFEVIPDVDLNKRRMTDRLLELKDKLLNGGPADLVLVYYSGHGMEIGGRNYLIPVGARIDRKERARDEAVDLQLLLEDLGDMRAPAVIVVLDSCRNDPFGKGGGGRFKGTEANPGFGKIDAPNGVLIAYATRPGTTALAEVAGENLSPFTGVFHQELKKPGASFQQVLAQTADKLKRKTSNRQSPWIEGEPGLQSIVLNFSALAALKAPQAKDDHWASLESGKSYRLPVLENDRAAQGGRMRVVSVEGVSRGQAEITQDGHSITYTAPSDGVGGELSFTYQVHEEGGGTATAQVILTLNASPEPKKGSLEKLMGAVNSLIEINDECLKIAGAKYPNRKNEIVASYIEDPISFVEKWCAK